jgi:uncharacterized protein YdhG (YjbR/CyaY superfamily)
MSSPPHASPSDSRAIVAIQDNAVMGEIDDYLAGLQGPQRQALQRVRDIALQVAPEASQGTSYGMPALRVAGKPLLGFHISKQHLSLHPFSPDVVAAVADDLEGFSLSKGTIRFTSDTPVPDAVLKRVVELRLAEITDS